MRQQPKVQTTPPPTIQGQKVGSLTPPSSPKTQRAGHRRILSDVTHSAVFGVPASKSTQLLQAAAAGLLRSWAWSTDDGALSCPRGAHSLVCLLPTRLRLLEDRDRHTHLLPGAQCTCASTVAMTVLYTETAVELDFTIGTFVVWPTEDICTVYFIIQFLVGFSMSNMSQ